MNEQPKITDGIAVVLNGETEGIPPQDVDQSYKEDCKGPDPAEWDADRDEESDYVPSGECEGGVKGPDPLQWSVPDDEDE